MLGFSKVRNFSNQRAKIINVFCGLLSFEKITVKKIKEKTLKAN